MGTAGVWGKLMGHVAQLRRLVLHKTDQPCDCSRLPLSCSGDQVRDVGRPRHELLPSRYAQDQRIALAATAAQRRGTKATASAAQFQREG